MNVGVIGSGDHIYKIPYPLKEKIEFSPAFLQTLEKMKTEPIKVLDEEAMDYQISFFKCPFRKYPSGEFKACLERNCMAFRANDKVFWCAMLEEPKGEERSLHPIEMLTGEDEDW